MPDLDPRMKKLYEQIPSFRCRPGCTDCCGGLLPIEKSEYLCMGRTAEEWQGIEPCTYMKRGVGCTVYEHRPLICRLFGTVPDLRCPHGCMPEISKMLSPRQGQEIIAVMAEIIEEEGGRSALSDAEHREIDDHVARFGKRIL